MNRAKAKQLRRYVKQIAIDDKTGAQLPKDGYYEVEKNRKYISIEKPSGDGKSTYTDQQQIAPGTIRVIPKTQRGIYKALKKSLKRMKLKS